MLPQLIFVASIVALIGPPGAGGDPGAKPLVSLHHILKEEGSFDSEEEGSKESGPKQHPTTRRSKWGEVSGYVVSLLRRKPYLLNALH